MLHINNITIKNFRPYYGVKKFNFGSEDGLSIILGDNGTGKSSLIRALKFVLYDEFDNDNAFKIKNELNIIAWEEQNFEMYVALEFLYNDDNYILKRTRSMKADLIEPKNDNDFRSVVILNKNGKILSTLETEQMLLNIIPKKISEYILFEGETISKYKNLLDNNKNQEIYDSIKKILGLPILENSLMDLRKQLERFDAERLKLAREQATQDKLKKELNSLQERKIFLTNDKNKCADDLIKATDQKNKYEEVLKNNKRINDLIAERAKLETNLSNNQNIIVELKAEAKKIIKNYKYFCKNIIEFNLKNIPDEISNLKKNQDSNKEKEENIKLLKGLSNSERCNYCGNEMGEREKENILNRIAELESKILPLTIEEEEKMLSHNLKVSRLGELLDGVPNFQIDDNLKNIETKIQNSIISVDGFKQQLKSIKAQIDELGGAEDLEQVTKAYRKLENNIELYIDTIERCDTSLKEVQYKIDQIINKNITHTDLRSIDSKIKTTKSLIEIFDSAIKSFSDKMRIKVQSDATELFKGISENQEYDKLEFDNFYGLKLIDKKGRVVPNVSSGYMTLITISLIYGLHKNSSLTGTIVLDAPFSVLTDFHRDRIISAFQKLSPQVILLVYKDQIDIQKIRGEMQGKLINEYEIYQNKENIDYSYKTDIRRSEN